MELLRSEEEKSGIDPRTQMERIQLETRRRRWRKNPALWAQERLGVYLWSKQIEIMEAVRDNRKTSVQSCHEIGKSFTAALVVCWWLDTLPHGHGFVVTSAPTASQVRTILWREIGRAHAKGMLPGRVNQTEWLMPMDGNREEIVALGRKPDEYNPTAFQGIHARAVLVVLDEACGIPSGLREAGDSLIANDDSKLLEIGNPDDPSTEFAKNCKPGSGHLVIRVSAFDTPNFTGEAIPVSLSKVLIGRLYVEEKARKWAPGWTWSEDNRRMEPPPDSKLSDTNPLWQSKILGLFPVIIGDSTLINLAWIRQAQERELQHSGETVIGLDVGAGGDTSCCCHKRGDVYRIKWEDNNPDTMATLGKTIATAREMHATLVNVDKIGIGTGLVNRAAELIALGELDIPFTGINVGESSDFPDLYLNKRAQYWWGLRELFENGLIDIDPKDEDLAAQLLNVKYKRLSNGKIQITDKRDISGNSPNRAEALMLAAAKAGASFDFW